MKKLLLANFALNEGSLLSAEEKKRISGGNVMQNCPNKYFHERCQKWFCEFEIPPQCAQPLPNDI